MELNNERSRWKKQKNGLPMGSANPDKTQVTAFLQEAHTQYKDEGGHPQQSTKKVVQFEMGSKRKYHMNNSIGIMLFCG